MSFLQNLGSEPEFYRLPQQLRVELATLEWVSWCNHHRLLEPIGYVPPAEYEANYYRRLAKECAGQPA